MSLRPSNPSTNNPQFSESRANQFNVGRVRVLDLDFIQNGTRILTLIPGKDILDRPRIRFWMKNYVWVLEDNGLFVDLTASTLATGGRLDGISLQANTRYLIWGIGKEGNVGVDGFGLTRKPRATWTAVSGGGTPGTTVTFSMAGTGNNNAFQFNVNGRIIARSQGGGPPNHLWNHGKIVAIPSATELSVELDSGLLGSGSLSLGGVAEIEQVSCFRPWNGVTPSGGQTFDDTFVSGTYRLLGEGLTNQAGNWAWYRRTIDEWAQLNISYPSQFPEGGTGFTEFDFWRYCPLWTNRVSCQAFYAIDFDVGTLAWNPAESTATSYLIFKVIVENPFGALGEGADSATYGQAPMMNNRHRFTSTAVLGFGTAQFFPTIVGIQDGGLRE